MQLTGDRFTAETAALGNDLATLPNFPAEIRAPQGTLPGVSSFQLQFADHEVLTPGDAPDVLVAMNPAALKANLPDLPHGGTVIADSDSFTKRNLTKVGYASSPLEDGSLESYRVHAVPLTSMTVTALAELGLGRKDAERSTNMFALGLLSWLYSRPTDGTRRFLESKFAKRPQILAANVRALEAGWAFGETTETFAVRYEVAPAPSRPGTFRNITGNTALALGLATAAHTAGPAAGARLVPDHPGLRHPPHPVRAQALRRDDAAGRGRDRRHRRSAGRGLRRRARRDDHVRARPVAQGRDARPRRRARAAAGPRRRAARRALDRAADQDRAGRPAAGHVRPPRRGPAADRLGLHPRRLLRRRAGRPSGSPSRT